MGSEKLSIDMGAFPLSSEVTCVIKPASVPGLEDVNMVAYDFSMETKEDLLSVMALTIPYDKNDLEGLDPEGNMAAAYYNEATDQWEPVSFTVNANEETVTIFTDHLSVYGCFAVKNENTRKAYAAYAIPSFALAGLYKGDANKIIISAVENGGSPGDDAVEAGLEIIGNVFAVGSAGADTISHGLNALSGGSGVVVGNSLFNAIGDRLGNIGLAISIAQVSYGMYNVYNGNEDGIFPCYANALKGSLSYTAGKAGMKLVSLSLLGVLVVEYSLNQFGEAAWEGRKDLYEKAYTLYYESQGVKRDAREWANIFLKAREGAASTERYQLRVEGLVQKYVEEFWQDETIVAEYQAEAQKNGFTGGGGLNEKIKEELSSNYRNQLYIGILQDAFKLIAEKDARRAEQELLRELNVVRNELNRVCTLELYDGSISDEKTRSTKADMQAFISVPDNMTDSESWGVTLDEMGGGRIQFTFLAFLMAGAPSQISLYQPGASREDDPTEILNFEMQDVVHRLNVDFDAPKYVVYKIFNMSGNPVVMDTDPSLDSFDVDAYDVIDFTVHHMDSISGGIRISEQIEAGLLVETSPTTYEATVYALTGAIPEDEDETYVYLEGWSEQTAFVHPITFQGTYNKEAIIHWDGVSFKQVE